MVLCTMVLVQTLEAKSFFKLLKFCVFLLEDKKRFRLLEQYCDSAAELFTCK